MEEVRQGRTIDELKLGEKASLRKMFTESDVCTFAQISGDINPLHLDQEYASTTVFKERIVHGMLTAGLISAVIGTQLPGVGTIYLWQNLRFTAPVKLGDTIEADVEVVAKLEEKNQARLRTICRNQRREIVIDGEALVMLPRRPS